MKGTGAKRNVCPGSCVSTGAKFPVAPVESAPMLSSVQPIQPTHPTVGCHYFPLGPQLPSQPLRGLLPILRNDGCEQFA